MRSVKPKLPEEIIQETGIPYEGVRDLDGIVFAIEGKCALDYRQLEVFGAPGTGRAVVFER